MSDERNIAWRRVKNHAKSGKGMGTIETFKPEKNWKMLYLRSEKLHRSKQLGFVYPRLNSRQFLDQNCTDE